MANDDTFGNMGSDDYEGFSLEDPSMDIGGRKPAGPAKKIITSTIRGAGSGVVSGTAGEIERQFPYTSGIVQEGISTIDEFKQLKSEIGSEVGPAVNSLKQIALRTMPFAKKLVPQKMYQKIEQKLKDSITPKEQSQEQYEAEQRSSTITNALNEVFAAQMEVEQQNREADMGDKQVDRQLDKVRFKQTAEALASIDQRLLLSNKFMSTATTAYMKKSLELKYKHLFVAKDTFNVMKGLAKVLEARLEEIKHNTSLPEYSKVKMGERVFGSVKAKMSEDLSSYISGMRGAVMKNISKAILSPLKQFTQMAIPQAELAASVADMGTSFGGDAMIPTKSGAAALVGKGLGHGLGWLFGTAKTRKLAEKMAPWINDTEATAKTFKTKAALGLRDLAERHRGTGGIPGALADFVPQYRASTFIDNTMLSAADQPVPFDNTVRQSIVEVMPRHLERIGMYIEGVAKTLAPNAIFDNKVYNVHARKLTSSDQFYKDTMTRELGTVENRAGRLSRKTGEFEAAFKSQKAVHGASAPKTSDFVRDKKLIEKFIINSGLYQQTLNPNAIRQYSISGTVGGQDADYINKCFTGIEDDKRRQIATYLNMMMFRPDGTRENVIVRRLGESIIEQIQQNSQLQRSLSLYSETLGMGSALDQVYDRKGGLKHEGVEELYNPLQGHKTKETSRDARSNRSMSYREIQEDFANQAELVKKFGGDAYGGFGTVKNKLVSMDIPIVSTLAKMMPAGMNDWLSEKFKSKTGATPEGALITPESIGKDGKVKEPTVNNIQEEKKGIVDNLVDVINDPEAKAKILTSMGIKDTSRLDNESDLNYTKRMASLIWELHKGKANVKFEEYKKKYDDSKLSKTIAVQTTKVKTVAKDVGTNLREGMPNKEEVLSAVAPEHRQAIESAYDSAQSVEDFLTKCGNTVKDPETWSKLRSTIIDGANNIKDPKKRKTVTMNSIMYVDNCIVKFSDKKWRAAQLLKAKKVGTSIASKVKGTLDDVANLRDPKARKLNDELKELKSELEEAKAQEDKDKIKSIKGKIRYRNNKLDDMGNTGIEGLGQDVKEFTVGGKDKVVGFWSNFQNKMTASFDKMMEKQRQEKKDKEEAIKKVKNTKIKDFLTEFGSDVPAESRFHQDFRTFAGVQIAANHAILQVLQLGSMGGDWGRHRFLGTMIDGTKSLIGNTARLGGSALGAYGKATSGLFRGIGSLGGGVARGLGSIGGGIAKSGLASGIGSAIGGMAKGTGHATAGVYRGVGEALKGVGYLGGGIAKGLGLAINPFMGLSPAMTNLTRRMTRDKYFDVYVKGNIDPGKPLLSAKEQEDGVVFADGKPLKNTMALTGPVFKPAKSAENRPKCLVTEDDIKKGLVDSQGRPLRETLDMKTGTLATGLFKGVGNIFKGVTGLGADIGKMWGKLLGGGSGMVLGGAKGLSKMVGRMFGLDLGANKEYQDKMLSMVGHIIKIMEDKHVAWDSDKDGIRDGSAQDQLSDMGYDLGTGKKKKKQDGGLLGALGVGKEKKKQWRPGDKVPESGDDGDGMGWKGIAGWLGGGAIASKAKSIYNWTKGLFSKGKIPPGGGDAATKAASGLSQQMGMQPVKPSLWTRAKGLFGKGKVPPGTTTVASKATGLSSQLGINAPKASLWSKGKDMAGKGLSYLKGKVPTGLMSKVTPKAGGLLSKGLGWAGKGAKVAGRYMPHVMLGQALYGTYKGSRMTEEEQDKFQLERNRGALGGGRLLTGEDGPLSAFKTVKENFKNHGFWGGLGRTGKQVLNDVIGAFDFVEHGKTLGVAGAKLKQTAGAVGKNLWDNASGKNYTLNKDRTNIVLKGHLTRLANNKILPDDLKELLKGKIVEAYTKMGAPDNNLGRQVANAATSLICSGPESKTPDVTIDKINNAIGKFKGGDKAYIFVFEKIDTLENALKSIGKGSSSTEEIRSDKTEDTVSGLKELSQSEEAALNKAFPDDPSLTASSLKNAGYNKEREVRKATPPQPTLPKIEKTSAAQVLAQKAPIKPAPETPAEKTTASSVTELTKNATETNSKLLLQLSDIVKMLSGIATATKDSPELQKSLFSTLAKSIDGANEANAGAIHEVGKIGMTALQRAMLPSAMPGGSPAGAAIGVEKLI